MRRSPLRLALVALTLALGGCGFHLAGERPLPRPLSSVYIEVVDPYHVSAPPLESALSARIVRGGGKVQSRSFDSLKPGGRLAWIAAGEAEFKVPEGKTIVRPNVARDRPHLERVAELAKSGAVKVPPMQIMKLEDIRKAHELSESRHVRGKLVFQIK